MSTAATARIALETGRIRQAVSMLRGLDATGWPAIGRGAGRLVNALVGLEAEFAALAARIGGRGLREFRSARLAALESAADRAIAESSVLIGGVLLRRHAGRDESCREAETLVEELAACVGGDLRRPVVPGTGEERRRSVDVIVRRTPDHGLWDLPVTAHEFGHVAASDLHLYDPDTQRILPAGWNLLTVWPGHDAARGEEFFCDVFATYALGPAYACTLLLNRLDPTSTVDRAGHPADVRRAEAVLAALARTATGPARPRWTVTRLEALWTGLAGRHPDEDLSAAVGQTLTFLDRHLAGLRYEWPTVVVLHLAERMRRGDAAPLPSTYRVRDVLNAAWMLRLQAWDDGHDLDTAVAARGRRLVLDPAAGDDAAA